MFAYPMNLTIEELRALLSHLEPEFQQVMIENVTCTHFYAINRPPDNFHFDSSFELSIWEKGRAFGEKMELRWRCRRESYAILIISDIPLSLPYESVKLPEAKRLEIVESLKVNLWGQWQDPNEEKEIPDFSRQYWYEERIPRFLPYPWDGCDKQLAIEVFKYRVIPSNPQIERDSLADFIYRFIRLVPAQFVADREMEEENND